MLSMLSDAVRVRRITAGSCLIAAPLLLLLGDVLGTRGPTTPADYLTAVAQNPSANYANIVLAIYGFALMVPAIFGIMHLLRRHSVALGHLGGALAILGFVSFAAVAGTEMINIPASDPQADRKEMLALIDRLGTSAAYGLINISEALGVLFGFLLLAVALFRARVVPRALAILLAAGVISRFIPASPYLAVIVSDALLFFALAGVGLVILSQSDEEWGRV